MPGPVIDLARLRAELAPVHERGGRLVIYFFSDDELQGIYDAIVKG